MKTVILASAAALAAAGCGQNTQPSPNLVVILADDLGYADLAVYGSERNSTPHLDRMAAEGLRFTDFHSSGPMCSPTRAALLTGLYPQRFGTNFEGALSGVEDYDTGLPLEARTIAEELGRAGYATGMFGKWHLGYQPPYLPTLQGFDEFRGLVSGDGDHHSHVDRSGRPDWWSNESLSPEDGYGVDLITRHSVDFIGRNRDRPFFLYVAHLAIHFPWQGPDDAGYRKEGGNYHDLSKLGQLDSLDVSTKVNEMVEAVDASAGAILDAVRQAGIARDTLVVFTSDNGGYRTYQGGYHNISENGPLRGQKTQVYEGGHRVPAIAWWPGRISPGETDGLAVTLDLFPTFLDLAGVQPEGLALDGISLSPLLLGQQPLPERTHFWRIRDRAAARRGRWKLVRIGGECPELYDLVSDLGETTDLASSHADTAAELAAALAGWEAGIAADKR